MYFPSNGSGISQICMLISRAGVQVREIRVIEYRISGNFGAIEILAMLADDKKYAKLKSAYFSNAKCIKFSTHHIVVQYEDGKS